MNSKHPRTAPQRTSLRQRLQAACLGLALSGSLSALGQTQNPSLVGTWPGFIAGEAQAVALVGTNAIVSVGEAGLLITTISSANPPVRLGSLDTPGFAYSTSVSSDGTLAYVADGEAGIHVIAITNITRPVLLRTVDTPGTARSIDLRSGYAYVSDGPAGVQIYSLADPRNPVRVGGFATPGEAVSAVSIPAPEGVRLYVATRTNGLVIWNVLNASQPKLLGAYSPGAEINDVVLNGYIAYLAAGNAGLIIITTTNNAVAAPITLGTLATTGYAHAVSRSAGSDVVQIAAGGAGVHFVTVTNPAAPVLLGSYNTGGTVRGVSATPTFAYVAAGESGFQIIRASTPTGPAWVGGLGSLRRSLGVAVAGNVATLANENYGLTTVDVSSPATPVQLGSISTIGAALSVAVQGDLACAAEGASGAEMVSVTAPANPVRLGRYDTPGNARGIALKGNLAAVADDTSGVHFLSITNPASPALLSTYDTFGWARRVALVDNIAYVADMPGGLVILSVTNPASPVWLSTHYQFSVTDLAVANGYAYLATTASGLQIVNVSNPANPVSVGGLPSLGSPSSIAISDQYAYVAGGTNGVSVVDVSNPQAPVLVGSYQTRGTVSGLAVSGHYLYVSDSEWGLTVLTLVGENHAKPTIKTQPVSQIALEGWNVSFSAAVVGATPLNYQWYQGGTPLAGQTESTLNLTGLTPAAAGDYTLVITNLLGAATSQVATLTVLPAGSAMGWFAATDRTTMGNWKGVYGTEGSLIIGAATNLTATFNGGGYFVFTPNTPNPAALERPGTTAVTNRFAACQFSGTTFNVDVTLPLGSTNRLAAYFMEPNGGREQQVDLIDIPTGTLLDSRTVNSLSNGVYLVWDVTGPVRLRCTRLAGANAVLSGLFVGTAVGQAPSLRAQPPATQFVAVGGNLALGAGVNGTPALAFQWSKDGHPLTDTAVLRGSTSPVLNLLGVTPDLAGTYSLLVTNALGQISGATSTVQVAASVPEKARFVQLDQTTRGNWKGVYGTAGQFIPGLTTNLPAGIHASLASGAFFAFNTNSAESIALEYPSSASVLRRFSAAQYSATQIVADLDLPDDATNRVTFYLMDPSGGRSESFELWDETGVVLLDSRLLSGFTSGAYLTYDIKGPVQARITRLAGANALLSGIFFGAVEGAAPVIRDQPPLAAIASVGSALDLGVGANGSAPLTWQWRRSGVPITESPSRVGTATPILGLRNLQLADAGGYTVLVSNQFGQVTSVSTLVTVISPNPAKGRFVLNDPTTMGNWKGVYGPHGSAVFGLATNLPPEVTLSFNGAAYFAFNTNTFEPVALERTDAASPTNRFAAVMYAANAFTLDVDLPVDVTNRLALYFMEPSGGRAQRVDLIDPSTGLLLDSRYLPTLTNGVYLTWDVSGPVRFRVTRLAGANAVLSGLFLGLADTSPVAQMQPPAAVNVAEGGAVVLGASFSGQPALNYEWRKNGQPVAAGPGRTGLASPVLRLMNLTAADAGAYTLRVLNPRGQTITQPAQLTVVVPDPAKGRFVMQDGTTLGNWKGVYGTDGQLIVGLVTNLPAADKQVTLANGGFFAFAPDTTAANALERPGTDSVTNRFAACQYDANAITVNVDLPGGVTNRVALYLMEPVSSRSERVELLGADGVTVLDTRTVSGLSNAVYLVYDVNGPVKVRLTRLAGANAVLSAVFLGSAQGEAPLVRTQPVPSVTASIGGEVTLAAGASGTPALAYRWHKDGLPLSDTATRSGSSKPVLTLTGMQGADAGNYALVISNPVGVTTSLTATVQFPPPVWFHFVQQDNSTLGNWQGVYGTQGHLLVGLSTNLPAPDQQITLNNGGLFVFNPSTTEANALERPAPAPVTDRLAACQFDANALLISVDLPTGVTNRIAFYLMEPGQSRTERFELLDPTGGIVLDSRTVSSLSNAVYLVYDVSTPVKARITRVAGGNAVLSGVFLGTATDVAPAMRVEPPATLAGTTGGLLSLGAGVSGSPALGYQWLKDGVALTDDARRSGSLKPVLNLSGILAGDAGEYALVTTNPFGVVTSQTAVVTITQGAAPATVPALFFAPPTVAGGQVHLNLVGEPGATYRIEFSTDLLHWQTLQTLTTPEGLIEITEPVDATSGMKFYRALKQ